MRAGQNKLDAARVTSARSKSFWQSECFLAAITTGDNSFAEVAEAAQQTLIDNIDKLIESAPTMESIIAVRLCLA